jgi:hypothetical protein
MRPKRRALPKLPLTPEDERAFRRVFRRERKARELPLDHGVGRFQVGDRVRWKASALGHERSGVIVQVVARGDYPAVCAPPDNPPAVTFPELNGHHYYRDHESYVVAVPFPRRDRRYWPRVGCLELVR